jgi:C-terminal processing protease CtpA/Prc
MNATLWPALLIPFLLVVLLAGGGCSSKWTGSVGAVLGKSNQDGRVFVRDVPPDMPAYKAGIREGDELVAIDGKPVGPMSPEDVHQLLQGDVGTNVTLTVMRGSERREVKVERGPLLSGSAGPRPRLEKK